MFQKRINIFLSIINNSILEMATPVGLTYLWNIGSLLGFVLVIQIVTGILLSLHYSSNVNEAFTAIVKINKEVNNGWLIRYFHVNGASFFFILAYLHIGKGIYYGSYLKKPTWFIGIIILFLLMAISFIGYVLPWGQMSLWGATVITNFISAIPYVGMIMTEWVWGGYSVGQPTLTRFFSFHYLFPFILAILVIIHILFLHQEGSSSPIGVKTKYSLVPFHWFYIIKDLVGIIVFIIIACIINSYTPYMFSEPENWIRANSMVTPIHIMPEWYFLFAYCILRCIPNKLAGVIALVASIAILFVFPFVHTSKLIPMTFQPITKFFYFTFIINFFLLTWLGSVPVYTIYTILSIHLSMYYFFYILCIFPIIGGIENFLGRIKS